MHRWIRATAWLVTALALFLVWRLDAEPPLQLGGSFPAARMRLVSLGEYTSADAVTFEGLFPGNEGAPFTRWHVVVRDTRAAVLTTALDRAADSLLDGPYPIRSSEQESEARVALEQALAEKHDWDLINRPLQEFVDQLSQALQTPIDLPSVAARGDRLTLVGPVSHAAALAIAHEEGTVFRAGRLRPAPDSRLRARFEQLWVLPRGIQGQQDVRLSHQGARYSTLRGLSLLQTNDIVGRWRPLIQLAREPLRYPYVASSEAPAVRDWRELPVKIPAGPITLGDLARLLARQSGWAIHVWDESERVSEFPQDFAGPLRQAFAAVKNSRYLREWREYLEIRPHLAGRGPGTPTHWKYYPLSELGMVWTGRDGQPLELGALRNVNELPAVASLRLFFRVGLGSIDEIPHDDPTGIFLLETLQDHTRLTKLVARESPWSRLAQQLHSGPPAARPEAIRDALAGDDPAAAAYAIWSLNEEFVPADRALLLRWLDPHRVHSVNVNEVIAVTFNACRRWCSPRDLAATVGAIARGSPPGESAAVDSLVHLAVQANNAELDRVLTPLFAEALDPKRLPKDSLDLYSILKNSLQLATCPKARDALRMPLLTALTIYPLNIPQAFLQPCHLSPLILEGLRHSCPDQRRQACGVARQSLWVLLPSTDPAIQEIVDALELLCADPLVANEARAALNEIGQASNLLP